MPPTQAKSAAVRYFPLCGAFLTAAVTLTGCAVGPKYARPAVEQPPSFKSPAPEGEQVLSEAWWQLYRDIQLDELIATANASNQTIRQAVARVDEARALARVAASFRYPTISLDPTVSRQRLSPNRPSTLTGAPVQTAATYNDWLVPFDLTYEADVFGRVRRSIQAARAPA